MKIMKQNSLRKKIGREVKPVFVEKALKVLKLFFDAEGLKRIMCTFTDALLGVKRKARANKICTG
jgi:hypothetical protein